ncbi:MAG: alanine racemase [Chloroflexi bacterium]|nr:alanine racemase [Chloroflexota bacterium]MCY3695976.1 alanine racemase [Chloroflexota bacterium]MXX79725.1 alanine racemase [Chloroflexota bacterium]MYF22270.1 alanine racemase [Chloroflexota bacterium]
MTQISTASTPAVSATSWAEIDLSAIRHNVSLLARMVEPAAVAAVVKADGYGHGAAQVSRAALEAGAALLCVFTVAEAEALRDADIGAPILSLGPLLPGDMARAAALEIAVVVDTQETAERLSIAAVENGNRVPVHINVDSGMQRYGRPREEVQALAEAIRAQQGLELEGVFTHFPDATNPDPEATLIALQQFARIADRTGVRQRHAAASAAAFRFAEGRFDFIRAGIALYGANPAPDAGDTGAGALRPVLSWRSTLLALRDVARGDMISYGGLWSAPRDSRIGVLGVGYADGLRRALSPGGSVLVRGRRAPIRGAICMDSTMVDLTEIPDADVGDVVTLIGADGGESIHAWELARRLETIPYEIFTGIAARVPRIAVELDG